MSKICLRCQKYNVVLVPDKTQPSKYAKIHPQSDSEAEHWTYMQRWIHVFPLEETDYCYYCTRIIDGRISTLRNYGSGFGYEERQSPMWSIG
jgi:hypothetical protein